jgi:NTP pyrophosphatase (non-canonical NTP hydrolase)
MIADVDIKDLEDYQEAAYGTAMPSALNRPYLFSGLAGEVGEVCSVYAKSVRDGVLDRTNLKKELGDVLWFVAVLSKDYGFTLSEVASANITKLKDRQARGTLSGNGDQR